MPHSKTPMSVLIVENDPDTRALFEYAKENPDVIFFVPGGIRALEQLKKIDYEVDAIVIDLMLGDMDGITLTENIRRNESIRSIPPRLIFWFTGHAMNSTLEAAKIDLRVTEIFLKPMDPTDLLYRVKAYLTAEKRAGAAGGPRNQ